MLFKLHTHTHIFFLLKGFAATTKLDNYSSVTSLFYRMLVLTFHAYVEKISVALGEERDTHSLLPQVFIAHFLCARQNDAS